MDKRYIMIVDGSVLGINERPIICLGDTIEELTTEFEQCSRYYFLDNQLHDLTYCPADIAVVFDMHQDGAPLKIEKVLQFYKLE